MKATRFLAAAAVIAAASCGGGDDVRQEVVLKLRALGVATNPVVATWSDSGAAPNEMELTVYAAIPLAQTSVTIVPYKDPRQHAPLTYAESEIVIDQSTLKITPVGALNLIEVKAKVTVPTLALATAAHAISPGNSGGQVNYGFKIDAGSEQELVTGTFMAYAAGAPELALTAPTVAIVEPVADAKLAKEVKGDLKATVVNASNEGIKLGWFTSGGEIQNRRAKETIWTRPPAGPQTVILTIRGKASRGFSMQVIPVTTE